MNPFDSDNWGLIGDYDPEYQYQFSETEYVVYKDKVYAPTMDVNADELKEGYNIRQHDPRNGNVKKHMLRLAIYEIVFDKDIPDSVAINEAVEIAKTYGQSASGGFVNAVLAKIAKLDKQA